MKKIMQEVTVSLDERGCCRFIRTGWYFHIQRKNCTEGFCWWITCFCFTPDWPWQEFDCSGCMLNVAPQTNKKPWAVATWLLKVIDRKFIKSPSKFIFLFFERLPLYSPRLRTRWIHEVNLKDEGNIPSGVPGYYSCCGDWILFTQSYYGLPHHLFEEAPAMWIIHFICFVCETLSVQFQRTSCSLQYFLPVCEIHCKLTTAAAAAEDS